jgi:hypothetical protein
MFFRIFIVRSIPYSLEYAPNPDRIRSASQFDDKSPLNSPHDWISGVFIHRHANLDLGPASGPLDAILPQFGGDCSPALAG